MSAHSGSPHEALQDGVLDALMHIASVSALDARELVIEFDAAGSAARTQSREDAGDQAPLAAAFRDGLSPERLKIIAAHYWTAPSKPNLSRLRRTLELVRCEQRAALPAYCAVVREAAHAAARASTGDGFRQGRHLTLLERAALREVEALLTPVDRNEVISG